MAREVFLCVRSFMAWNWYPPVDPKAENLPPRLHAHADMDIITLLYQRPGRSAMTAGLTCHCHATLRLKIEPASRAHNGMSGNIINISKTPQPA